MEAGCDCPLGDLRLHREFEFRSEVDFSPARGKGECDRNHQILAGIPLVRR
jgi:hypothetical protein